MDGASPPLPIASDRIWPLHSDGKEVTAPSSASAMNPTNNKLFAKAKPWLRPLVRATLGRLPRSSSRFTGALAKEGGTAVRNIRYRPWAGDGDGHFLHWHCAARAQLRRVFLSGIEGLPQPLAQEFAQQ